MIFEALRIIIGTIFFVVYYLLMHLYFQVQILEFPYILLTIYFALAVITFPYSEKAIGKTVESTNFPLPNNILSPFIYVISPIYTFIKQLL